MGCIKRDMRVYLNLLKAVYEVTKAAKAKYCTMMRRPLCQYRFQSKVYDYNFEIKLMNICI